MNFINYILIFKFFLFFLIFYILLNIFLKYKKFNKIFKSFILIKRKFYVYSFILIHILYLLFLLNFFKSSNNISIGIISLDLGIINYMLPYLSNNWLVYISSLLGIEDEIYQALFYSYIFVWIIISLILYLISFFFRNFVLVFFVSFFGYFVREFIKIFYKYSTSTSGDIFYTNDLFGFSLLHRYKSLEEKEAFGKALIDELIERSESVQNSSIDRKVVYDKWKTIYNSDDLMNLETNDQISDYIRKKMMDMLKEKFTFGIDTSWFSLNNIVLFCVGSILLITVGYLGYSYYCGEGGSSSPDASSGIGGSSSPDASSGIGGSSSPDASSGIGVDTVTIVKDISKLSNSVSKLTKEVTKLNEQFAKVTYDSGQNFYHIAKNYVKKDQVVLLKSEIGQLRLDIKNLTQEDIMGLTKSLTYLDDRISLLENNTKLIDVSSTAVYELSKEIKKFQADLDNFNVKIENVEGLSERLESLQGLAAKGNLAYKASHDNIQNISYIAEKVGVDISDF